MFHADSCRVHIDFYCHDVTILQPSVSNQAFFMLQYDSFQRVKAIILPCNSIAFTL